MNKKAWLDTLYYDVGKQQYDFYICNLKKVNGETKSTKWKKYSECIFPIDFDGTSEDKKDQKFFEQINQRQILPIEIVLDIENKNQLRPIIKKLKEWKILFYAFSTGSKGYHIHIFFDEPININDKFASINFFKTDTMKCSDKTMIALEFTPHWKTGRIKNEIKG